MRWMGAILLGGFTCLCISLAAPSCAPASDSVERPAKVDYQRPVNSPKTILNILRNVKVAISGGLLLQEQFYRQESFEKYFGATAVDWRRKPTADFRSGYLASFSIPNPPETISGSKLEAISATFMYEAESSKITATWSFTLLQSSGVDFYSIESIYGRHWQLAPSDLPSVHKTQVVATRLHGNSRIIYKGRDGQSSYQFLFSFYPNATLNTVEIFLESQVHQ